MTKIKESNKVGFCSIFEDPRPTKTDIYFYGEGHDQSTLAPLFDKNMKFSTSNGVWEGFGFNQINTTSVSGYNDANSGIPGGATVGASGSSLVLSKPSTHVQHTLATHGYLTNLDYCYAFSLDPNYRTGRAQLFTDGSQYMITWNYYRFHTQGGLYWDNASLSNDLSELTPSNSYAYNPQPAHYQRTIHPLQWMYRNPSNNYISGIANLYTTFGSGITGLQSDTYGRPAMSVMRLSSFPSYSSQDYVASTFVDHHVAQFIGPSTIDLEPIYLLNSNLNDYTNRIYKHNTTANSVTTLHSFSSIPLVDSDGTNDGGARSQAGAIGYQTKLASSTFMDPTDSDDLVFYLPYFDSDQDYHPFYFQWDRSTDTFTRNEDIVITGDLSSTYITGLDGINADDNRANTNAFAGLKSIIYNETFTYNGDRFLTVWPLDGGYRINDVTETARKFVTYSVNATNPKSLTHHSAVTIPYTIKNIAFLNDARTSLGVICENVFYYYVFDNVNGWDLKSTLPYRYWAVGYDKLGQIWAIGEGNTGYSDIHLISASLPLTVTISAANESYNYSGSTINSTLSVSAYNLNGVRVETNVTLTIEGSTMTFDDDTASKTITTSASADTSVAIKIIGAGLSNVVASITI
jgi:hypothetical protein